MITRRSMLIGVAVLSRPSSRAAAQDGLPDLVGQLARERSYAEQGAALLKTWMKKPSAVLQGQRLYADAKTASDEAIAYLAAALAASEEPNQDKALRQKLEAAAEKRLAFSHYVDASLDALAGKKNVVADALTKTAGEVVKGLIGAAVDIWKVNQATDTVRRETMRHQVEAERWRSFGEVPAV
jgi:hypothetical protein